MNATTIEAYALSKGINTAYKDMENQQKVGLAMEMFMEKTAYAAGNYAKENETLAGSLATAKAAMSNFLSGAGDVDSLVNAFTNAADVIVRNLGELLPRLTTGIGEIVQKLAPKIPELIGALLPSVIDGGISLISGLTAALPDVLGALARSIMTVFNSSISEQTSQVRESATGLIDAFVDGLSANMDLVLTAGLSIFNSILDGVNDILPKLVPLALDVLTAFANGFISYQEMIFTTGVDILAKLIQGISEKLPELIPKAKEAIMNIAKGLAENLPEILKSGIEIITQLALGIAETLPKLIPVAVEAILTLVDTFLDNIDMLIDAAIAIIFALAEGLIDALPNLLEKAPIIIEKLVSASVENVPKLLKAAAEINIKIKKGIIDNLPLIYEAAIEIIAELIAGLVKWYGELTKAALEIVDIIWKTITETDWLQLGKNIIDGIVKGITGGASRIWSAIKGVVTGTVNDVNAKLVQNQENISKAFSNTSTTFSNFSKTLDEVASQTTKVTTANNKMGNLAVSTAGKIAGANDKIGNSAKSAAGKVVDAEKEKQKAEKESFDKTKKWIENRKFFGLLSLEEELVAWEDYYNTLDKNSEYRIEVEKNLYTIRNKLIEESFNKSKSWIEKEVFYNRRSTEQQIEDWERVAARYEVNTKEREEADRNLYTLRNKLEEESFSNSKKIFELRKSFGMTSMQDEINFWEEKTRQYIKGSKQREEADKALFDARNRLYAEQEKIADKMEAAEKTYADQLESRANSLMRAFGGIFAELTEKEDKRQTELKNAQESYDKYTKEIKKLNQELQIAIQNESDVTSIEEKRIEAQDNLAEASKRLKTAQKEANKSQIQIMTENLNKQLDIMTQYSDDMQAIMAKGILSEETLKEIKSWGPDAYQNIAGLATATDKELEEFNKKWTGLSEITMKIAIDDSKEAREETDKKIAGWMDDLSENMKSNTFGEDMIQGWIDGINEKEKDLFARIYELTNGVMDLVSGTSNIDFELDYADFKFDDIDVDADIDTDIGVDIDSADMLAGQKEIFSNSFEEIKNIVLGKLSDMSYLATTIIDNMIVKISDILSIEGFKLGQTFIDSLGEGLMSLQSQLQQQASLVADSIRSAFSDDYNVNMTVGRYASGLAYVPFNNFPAYLDEGERVLTKAENQEYARNDSIGSGNITIVIENFNNNNDYDIARLSQDLAFYMNQQNKGRGR